MFKVKLGDYSYIEDVPDALKNAYTNKISVFYDFAKINTKDSIDALTAPQLSLLQKEHYR